MFRLPDNTRIHAGQPFLINNTAYPANWLDHASPDDLAGVGIVYETDPVVAAPTPPAPTLAEAKAAAIRAVNAACDNTLSAITAPYPQNEIVSWDAQFAEAAAWTASNTAPTPLISAIVAANGATVAAQAASILVKASAFKVASGALIGRRQLLTDQINATTTASAAAAILW